MNLTTIIIIAVVVIFVIVVGVISFISTNKIKKNGIETEATISRIDRQTTHIVHDESGMVDTDTTETYYVKYQNQNGEMVEAELINSNSRLKEGDTIKIKYLPEKPNKVLKIKD